MLLIIHIAAALGSLLAAALVYVNPSVHKLRITNALTALMFLSGTILVVQNTAHLLKACVMGLALLSVVVVATTAARHKLQHQSIVD